MKWMKLATLAIIFCLPLAGCDQPADSVSAPPPDATAAPTPAPISNTELQQRIVAGDAPLILDVRSTDEYESGHIPGAVNIAHTDVGAHSESLPLKLDTEIIVHCQSGRRAEAAQATLTELGYTNIRHLDGDIAGWKAAGLPLE